MEGLVVGFTGRREGFTEAQIEKLKELLVHFLKNHKLLCIHNDGEGADKMFRALAADLGASTGVTPYNLGHMARNRYLVEVSDVLIGLPPTDKLLQKGSGTWETIKYMWKKPGVVYIILSDGTVRHTKDEVISEEQPIKVMMEKTYEEKE